MLFLAERARILIDRQNLVEILPRLVEAVIGAKGGGNSISMPMALEPPDLTISDVGVMVS